MTSFSARLQAGLEARRAQGRYRSRLTLDSAQGPRVRLDGRDYLNFSSNDYLGLASHPRVVERLRSAALEYGAGSGASHLVSGHSRPHHELEEALAAFTGRSRALLFSSGYMANVGVLGCLLEKGDQVFEDRLNHASLLDGGLASAARFRRFAHNDCGSLARLLEAAEGNALVVVDGVFSMDGDSAPLAELAALCHPPERCLMVDDAHGFGVLGERGAGSLEAAGLGQDEVPVLMATLGKALGTAGAFVAGSELLVESLIQGARNYIYTTALPPAVAAATLESLRLVQEEDWRRTRLIHLVARFREGAESLGLSLLPSSTPIQPLLVGDDHRVLALAASLRDRGLLVGAIRPPTVPEGTGRLRITLCASHSDADVDRLLDELARCSGDD